MENMENTKAKKPKRRREQRYDKRFIGIAVIVLLHPRGGHRLRQIRVSENFIALFIIRYRFQRRSRLGGERFRDTNCYSFSSLNRDGFNRSALRILILRRKLPIADACASFPMRCG